MLHAPLALAFERAVECRIYQELPFPRPILDLGCGEGLFAHILFAEKIDAGVDPAARELERAQELRAYEELILCPGDAIPKPDGFYQTVLSNSVLEHIADLEPVLREVHRIVAPGGRFYFTVPSPLFCRYTIINQLLMAMRLNHLAVKFRRRYNIFWKHYHDYPLAEWKELVQKAGFEITASWSYGSKKRSLLNDLLVPFGFFAFLCKRLTNRWIIMPGLRQFYMRPLYRIVRKYFPASDQVDEGGLIFIAARKELP